MADETSHALTAEELAKLFEAWKAEVEAWKAEAEK